MDCLTFGMRKTKHGDQAGHPQEELEGKARYKPMQLAIEPVYDENGQYKGAPLPSNEELRLSVLHKSDLLSKKTYPAFDRLTKLLWARLGVASTLITLVGRDEQFVKSATGEFDAQACPSHPRAESICAFTFFDDNTDSVLSINDLRSDPKTKDNPLVVSPPYFRAYLGAPISLLGHRVGTLCAIDSKRVCIRHRCCHQMGLDKHVVLN